MVNGFFLANDHKATLPLSDPVTKCDSSIILTTSIDPSLRSFKLLGEIKQNNLNGCIVKIDSVEIPNTKKLKIYVLLSKEHKFGRWLGKLPGARNALVNFTVNL